MIILDTCILRGCGLESSSADLLRAIQGSGSQRVAVPWIVLEELVAQHAVKYSKEHEDAVQAISGLKKVTPWKLDVDLGTRDPERVREHWRQKYGALVDVVPTSENALREAALREANGLAPAKIVSGGKSVKTGYRDVAIWVSAVEYARAHPEEMVFFVSSNTSDFGDGSTHAYPMDQDLGGLRGRFVHLTSLDQVARRFTEPVEVDEARVRAILERQESLTILGSEAARLMRESTDSEPFEVSMFRNIVEPRAHSEWSEGWQASPVTMFEAFSDLQAHKIDDRVWCTATARWLLAGIGTVITPGRASQGFVTCSWETRILFTLQEDEPGLVVLRGMPPQSLTSAEIGRFTEAISKLLSVPTVGSSLWNALREAQPPHRLFPPEDSGFVEEAFRSLMRREMGHIRRGHRFPAPDSSDD